MSTIYNIVDNILRARPWLLVDNGVHRMTVTNRKVVVEIVLDDGNGEALGLMRRSHSAVTVDEWDPAIGTMTYDVDIYRYRQCLLTNDVINRLIKGYGSEPRFHGDKEFYVHDGTGIEGVIPMRALWEEGRALSAGHLAIKRAMNLSMRMRHHVLTPNPKDNE